MKELCKLNQMDRNYRNDYNETSVIIIIKKGKEVYFNEILVHFSLFWLP